MSRMTKYLKQTCTFERASRDASGDVKLNKYGDVIYDAPIQLRCRCERLVKDVQTNTGAVLQSSTRYFLDETQVVQADDRIDGIVVLQVEEYANQLGLKEGYEIYV